MYSKKKIQFESDMVMFTLATFFYSENFNCSACHFVTESKCIAFHHTVYIVPDDDRITAEKYSRAELVSKQAHAHRFVFKLRGWSDDTGLTTVVLLLLMSLKLYGTACSIWQGARSAYGHQVCSYTDYTLPTQRWKFVPLFPICTKSIFTREIKQGEDF